jgi:type I restriction-modification system DNA methylase subunit
MIWQQAKQAIQAMSTHCNEITDREKLRDHIHRIHDFLRNRGMGIGMTALKIFNLFYALKLIDGKRKELGLTKVCSWAKIKKLKKENIILHIVGRNPEGDKIPGSVLDELFDNPATRHTIFYEIPRDASDDTYHKIIQLVDKIPVANTYDVDLAGKIYEYFIGYGDKTSQSELGAYFTDRHITNFIMDEIKPQIIRDPIDETIGHVPHMIDPFGGSGGFTLTYTRWMAEKYRNMIDWKNEINTIHHQDISEDVVKSASLEMYVLTGQFPMAKSRRNFKRINSFEAPQLPHAYDYILSNPPYGGDKNKKNAEQTGIELLIAELEKRYPMKESQKKRTKKGNDVEDSETEQARAQYIELKNRIKEIKDENNLDMVNIHTCNKDLYHYLADLGGRDSHGSPLIPANDKEACSLLMFMRMVAINGTVCGVLKEGVFFDSKYSEIRRLLLENFNVEQVIGVPSDEFENTATKTSILIFRNNGKTQRVMFSELVVEKHKDNEFGMTNGELRLVHRKDQIKGVKKNILCEATFEQIAGLKTGERCLYSLDPKKYIVSKVECSDKYELIRLKDLCKINYGDRITKKQDAVDDSYAGTKYPVYGGGNITFYTKKQPNRKGINIVVSRFGMSESCVRILEGNIFLNDSALSVHAKNADTDVYLGAYLLNNTKLIYGCGNASAQKNLNVDLFKDIQIPVPRTKELLDYWVGKLSAPYNAIQSKRKALAELELAVKTEVQRIGDEEECDMMALGELCEINDKKIKKYDTSYGKDTGIYKFHTGATNGALYCDVANIDKWAIIMNKTNGSGKCNIFLDKNISCAKQTFILQSDTETRTQYIYHVMIHMKPELEKGYMGACHKNLSHNFLEMFKIPVPRDKSLISALEPRFAQIAQLIGQIKAHEQEYANTLVALADDIKPNTQETKHQDDQHDDQQDSQQAKPSKKAKHIDRKKAKSRAPDLSDDPNQSDPNQSDPNQSVDSNQSDDPKPRAKATKKTKKKTRKSDDTPLSDEPTKPRKPIKAIEPDDQDTVVSDTVVRSKKTKPPKPPRIIRVVRAPDSEDRVSRSKVAK